MAKKFQCDVCDKKFSNKYYLITHQSVHTTETPYACTQCSYRGKTKKYLARHIRQIHKEKSGEHKCSVCGKVFHHPSSLKVHAMVHTGEKPHSCNVCGKTFRVTYSLNSHMLIHTNEKPFACCFCDYACRDSSTLRKHQNKHMGLEKIYECKICNKGYKSRAALKIHISETHLDVDVRKYPCGRCDRVFKTNTNRRIHIEAVHERSLVCTCPVCGRRLMSRNNLSSHMRTHLHQRPFSCTHPGCGLSFKNKNSLTKHSVIHNPDLHFPCSHCGRKFARKTHVQRHERVMHVERGRKVECHYCGSRFYSKNYLIKHIQTKHVYKQNFKYICDICGLTTHNKPSIVMHLKYGHSNDDDMQCKICDSKIVYKRHIYLKLHYWNTHNIKYKMTRKSNKSKKVRDRDPSVEVKVEPIEAESYEEIQLLEVTKKEDEEDLEDDSLGYSKRVLSEDITESVLQKREYSKEVDFDEFFIRHVFAKHEDKDEQKTSQDGVNEEQNELVKQKIKQIITRTAKIEKEKALREKQKMEEREKRAREIEEAKIQAQREREELVELRRVRVMYNERMKAALAMEKQKKGLIQIKYFKKNTNKTIEETKGSENMNDAEDLNISVINTENIDVIANNDSANDDVIANNDSVNDTEDVQNINDKNDTSNNGEETARDLDKCTNSKDIEDIREISKNVDENDAKQDDSLQNIDERKNQEYSEGNNEIESTSNDLNDNSLEKNDISDSLNETNDTNDSLNETNGDAMSCDDNNDIFDQPLLKRRLRSTKAKTSQKIEDDEDEEVIDQGKAKKMEFKTFQCYICFKLYKTKQDLIDHCQEHFDICHEKTLTKCPICNYVSHLGLAKHMKRKHDVTIKIPFNKIQEKKTESGSKYCYDIEGTIVEVVPSIKILNKTASDEIDKKRRDKNNKTISKSKLVKKGDNWIVEKESVDIKFDEIPELNDRELNKLKVSDNDVDRLGQLSYIAKKKGLGMMFPCFHCEKICLNFSALKLHKRRHEENPKPFKPRVKRTEKLKEMDKNKLKDGTKVKLNKDNRTAFPKPILNKHKCDKKLKEFFESNIRGGDIEFWQFLKIFNKMDKEKINDFKDLEKRTDFGNHLDYYKDKSDDDNENDDIEVENNDNEEENNDKEENNDDEEENEHINETDMENYEDGNSSD